MTTKNPVIPRSRPQGDDVGISCIFRPIMMDFLSFQEEIATSGLQPSSR